MEIEGPDPDDADLRTTLQPLGPGALRELRQLLNSPSDARNDFPRALMTRRPSAGSDALAQLVALADTDATARLRVLRAIRDLGV